MSILAECQECFKQYRVPDDKAGRKFRCRGCNAFVHVPDGHEDEYQDASWGEPEAPISS
ncbi:MAG: hypothetical protein MK102_11310 [Fuerstiella sp.]|nr:hypothetical protein [Fuerstiella sp.]